MKHDLEKGLLIDVGCGPGYLSTYFENKGIFTVGIDISRDAIKYWKNAGHFVLTDALKLPFKDNCSFTVILNDVLEHIPYALAYSLVKEIKRILGKEGKLYISVANRFEIREPHTQIPFITWFPKCCWDDIFNAFLKRGFEVYPYSFREMRKLAIKANMRAIDLTWIYASHKIFNTDYVGDRVSKKIIEALKRVGLLGVAYAIAKKTSVLLFVFEPKFETSTLKQNI